MVRIKKEVYEGIPYFGAKLKNKKDLAGRELKIGDIVSYTEYNTSNLKIGIVIGETDTKVKVAKWTYFCPDEYDTNCEFAYTAYTNKEPCNVIILNTDGLNIE